MTLDLEALETSFDLVAPHGDELMDEFYSRLFATAPSVRPLFPTDMQRQKVMLLGALHSATSTPSSPSCESSARDTSRTVPGPSTTRSSAPL